MKGDKNVDAIRGGKIVSVSPKDVDYSLPHPTSMYGPATITVPFPNSAQGNRLIMGAKQATQALPLLQRDAPYVQSRAHTGLSAEQELAKETLPTSPCDGKIGSIDDHYIHIIPTDPKSLPRKAQLRYDGKTVKVPYARNYPFMSKTHINHEIIVKAGDQVKAGQLLADSNFTRNGAMALGKNLAVAYMPYYGNNSNDAVVISATAAEKLRSMHSTKITLDMDTATEVDRQKHRVYFGAKYTEVQYNKLDARGIIKPGSDVREGDIIIAAVRRKGQTAEQAMLGRLHKSLVKPHIDAAQIWEYEDSGKVIDVVVTAKRITVTVQYSAPMRIGDKLCFDAATEVLTQNGWKPVAQVTCDDRVATLQDGMEIVYEQPQATHVYPQGGKMYRMESQLLDVFVTAEHRNYIKRRDHKHFSLVPAAEHFGKRVSFKKDGVWTGKSPDYVSLPAMCVPGGQGGRGTVTMPEIRLPVSTYCMLLGMYLSEGNIVDQPDSGSYGIDVCQIKEPNRQTMLDALDAAGLKYSLTTYGTKVRLYGKQLMERFKSCGTSSGSKRIPTEVFGWAREDLKTLFDWLMWGDGHVKHGRPINYTSICKGLIDDVQRLALHIGIAANVRQTTDLRVGTIKGKDYLCQPRFVAQFVSAKLTPTVNHGHTKNQAAQIEEMIDDYDQPVYCVTVPNHVLYVRRNGKSYWSGNSGRFGNKGVISTIVPDDQMVKDEEGKIVDVIVTSAGVISRINPNQIIEGALGKVAEKTGKPILIEPFADQDNVQFAKDMLKKHNVKDKEQVFDPASGKQIPGIFVGRTYMYRLFKSTDTNFSARGVGPGYDANMQPSKGGDSGSKAIGKMDFNALLSHNARGILRESATIKSERNDEFWRRVQLGLPLPAPKQTFAYDKFLATLQGAGINVKREGKALTLAPMTDRDIDAMAEHTIKSPLVVKNKQTARGQMIEPEKDGLFDPVATGGMSGTRFAKIELPEPVINPIFEEAARRLLGMSAVAFNKELETEGGAAIRDRLNRIDVKSEIARLRPMLKTAKGTVLDDLVKRVKYLTALEKQGLRPGEAYVLSKIPVVPPVMRPVMPSAGGSTLVSDVNYLYRDLMLATKGLEETPEILRTPEFMAAQRRHIQDSVGALFGTQEPVSPQNQGRGVKGHLMQITGSGSPKYGFFQAKILKRQQDLSGRATIAPDHTLGIDEVGLPEEQAWGMYRPFIVGRLVKAGYPAKEAADMVDRKDPAARQALVRESLDRPVFINRAPTLHRYSLVAAYPKLIPGKTMRLNPFAETGMNADYDGDALQIHLPATPEAVADAKNMTLSNLVFGDKVRDTLMIFPAHEAIIGLFMATEKGVTDKPPLRFATKQEAMAAYKAGKLKLTDPVVIAN
ncbi:MAG: hypothetical protein E6R03_07775 [Hyphomicrobiaceae bacterium]|nr:MAG: hypothetical protein E6R03_07775 [Hyphomicrobiaceae bacterium]